MNARWAAIAAVTSALALMVGCGGDDESSSSGSGGVKAPEGQKAMSELGEGEGQVVEGVVVSWAPRRPRMPRARVNKQGWRAAATGLASGPAPYAATNQVAMCRLAGVEHSLAARRAAKRGGAEAGCRQRRSRSAEAAAAAARQKQRRGWSGVWSLAAATPLPAL